MKSKVFILMVCMVASLTHAFAQNGANYQYDGLHRLLQVSYPNGAVIQYTYDAVGNRTTMVVNGNQPTQFTITANASPTNSGTVSGGGQYNAGSTCTLIAVPASGYQFDSWKKNGTVVSTDATYSFTVTENATYTAYFGQVAPTQYNITVNANNNVYGIVSGGGQYNAGATCTLMATPASDYQFESWKKNGVVVSTDAIYSFIVTENATYTAYFSETPITYYVITTDVMPAVSGSVAGGGTYQEGSTITLTAMANNGCSFSQWQDGDTNNPRTITVTGNAHYTAMFIRDQYQITTNVSPAASGTVSGGGFYYYGDCVTLTATSYNSYEFVGWQDGNSDNPRVITVTGNANYTAVFSVVGSTYYTVTANASPSNAGMVNGSGVYEEGTCIVLMAVPNTGYTFDHWQDGTTQNPRTVTVNSNLSFTAYFNQNHYILTVGAVPVNAGQVSGGGAYYYGDTAMLSAVSYSGYEFVGWSDGSSENPHQVLVTGNATYTATFSEVGATYYTVSACVSPAGAGMVSGTGTFPAGGATTLTAMANNGYTFDHWNDGSTANPRTVTINNNMSFTAFFNANRYTITTNVTPSGAGRVIGGGSYPYGVMATLKAIPNGNYEFMQWSDGNLQNPRTFTVTQNATFTAIFSNGSGEMYTLTVSPSSPFLGETYGSGIYPAGSAVEISAFPCPYARFLQWSDGVTENPRLVVVEKDTGLVAEFVAARTYSIVVESAAPYMGTTYGGGTFKEGTEIVISAVANAGYYFTGWQDGSMQNPRNIVVTGDANYMATFAENEVIVETHMLTVISNPNEGTVSGGGAYYHGVTAMLLATANAGYTFLQWSDGNTDNPRYVWVDSDMTFEAIFRGLGVDENDMHCLKLYPNPAHTSIHVVGAEADSELQIIDCVGKTVKIMKLTRPDEEIYIGDLPIGLYLIRCGNNALRFVKH